MTLHESLQNRYLWHKIFFCANWNKRVNNLAKTCYLQINKLQKIHNSRRFVFHQICSTSYRRTICRNVHATIINSKCCISATGKNVRSNQRPQKCAREQAEKQPTLYCQWQTNRRQRKKNKQFEKVTTVSAAIIL